MKFIKGCFTIIGILFILSIVGAIIAGNSDSNKQASQTQTDQSTSTQTQEAPAKPAEPAISVTAAQLIQAYDANELSADQKYKGKVAKITGKVSSIQKMMGSSFITLGSGKDFEVISVQAFFDESQEGKLASLQKGQQLTVQCTIDGKSMNIGVRECTF